jgi:hypothetical protein
MVLYVSPQRNMQEHGTVSRLLEVRLYLIHLILTLTNTCLLFFSTFWRQAGLANLSAEATRWNTKAFASGETFGLTNIFAITITHARAEKSVALRLALRRQSHTYWALQRCTYKSPCSGL